MYILNPVPNTATTKVDCKLHNFSKIIPNGKLSTQGWCKYCKREEREVLLEKVFKEKSVIIHKNNYSYEKVKYLDNRSKVEIYCKLHDFTFYQSPADHLAGKTGCRKCIIKKQPQLKPKSKEDFVEQSNKVHNFAFSYEAVNYISNKKHVEIKCKEHNYIFKQTPNHHLNGKNGCLICSNRGHSWSKSNYKNIIKDKKCIFYIIYCFNDQENFYKIRNYV